MEGREENEESNRSKGVVWFRERERERERA